MSILFLNVCIGAAIKIELRSMIGFMDTFLEGALNTLTISIITVFFGCIIGFLATLLRRSKYKILNWIVILYAQVVRGTPVLLQIYIICYGLPIIGFAIPGIPGLKIFGLEMSALVTRCIVALSFNSGAYISEIFRSGLNSVDKGQEEASRSLGLSGFQTMRHIILPQAIKNVIPALGNEFIMMIKESAMVSIFGVFDVMYTKNVVSSLTYKTFEPLIVIACIYLILTTMCTFLLGIVERKLNTDD